MASTNYVRIKNPEALRDRLRNTDVLIEVHNNNKYRFLGVSGVEPSEQIAPYMEDGEVLIVTGLTTLPLAMTNKGRVVELTYSVLVRAAREAFIHQESVELIYD